MAVYDRKDKYFRKAKEKGYRSRSAFKLLEIDKKFSLLRVGDHVIDLGCAPGGWMQILGEKVGEKGLILGVDLEDIAPFSEKNISFIRGDVRDSTIQQRMLAMLGRKVDVVTSDMAPHITGVKFQDQYHSYELAEMALHVCKSLLREGGSFVTKIFPGSDLEKFKKNLQESFSQIKTVLPEAIRKSSNEIYLVAKGFRKI